VLTASPGGVKAAIRLRDEIGAPALRAPHYTAHLEGLLEEAEIARGGILLLDEVESFRRSSLELLRDKLLDMGHESPIVFAVLHEAKWLSRLAPWVQRLSRPNPFEEEKIGSRLARGHFHVPQDARARLDRLADEYRLLSAELDERLAAGAAGIDPLEARVEELADLLEHAAVDLETGETELGARQEVMPGLEGQLADLYAQYLQGADRFRTYPGGPATRKAALAEIVRMVASSKIGTHGGGWREVTVTDDQAVSAARDAYERRLELRAKLGGPKAPWARSPQQIRAWARRRRRNPARIMRAVVWGDRVIVYGWPDYPLTFSSASSATRWAEGMGVVLVWEDARGVL